MTSRIDVDLASAAEDVPSQDEIEGWISRALDGAGKTGDVEVSVRIVDRDEIRTLNRDYRHRDKATNVLSFPSGDIAGLPDQEPQVLGDIVVCAGVVADEADAQGKKPMDHWAHMLVHGTLHLLGYDHEQDDEAQAMEALETRILGELGVADPYA
ncbi:MAG: rRNA maturation RNase YbeY [Woeseiaceae bacterium]|nr:rRNA maturation RNase YbeY [Woeseiaceae bacterium]